MHRETVQQHKKYLSQASVADKKVTQTLEAKGRSGEILSQPISVLQSEVADAAKATSDTSMMEAEWGNQLDEIRSRMQAAALQLKSVHEDEDYSAAALASGEMSEQQLSNQLMSAYTPACEAIDATLAQQRDLVSLMEDVAKTQSGQISQQAERAREKLNEII